MKMTGRKGSRPLQRALTMLLELHEGCRKSKHEVWSSLQAAKNVAEVRFPLPDTTADRY